nr:15632_t:CDS:2 [Entrophospora candida]
MIWDVIVGGRWLVEEQIGEGSFGQVFRAKHMTRKDLVAIKREDSSINFPQLADEYKLLKMFEEHEHVPKVYWYGPKIAWNCMVMDLLGPSLKLVTDSFQALPVDKGIVHRDIKSENFLLEDDFPISLNDPEEVHNDICRSIIDKYQILVGRKYKTFLVDFGLASYYIDQETGIHIQDDDEKIINGLKTGTAQYASINVHRGCCKLFIIHLNMLKGFLPWSKAIWYTDEELWTRVLEIKEETSLVDLCIGIPRGETRGSGPNSRSVTIEDEWYIDRSWYNHDINDNLPSASATNRLNAYDPKTTCKVVYYRNEKWEKERASILNAWNNGRTWTRRIKDHKGKGRMDYIVICEF